jgi:hypothetical protein
MGGAPDPEGSYVQPWQIGPSKGKKGNLTSYSTFPLLTFSKKVAGHWGKEKLHETRWFSIKNGGELFEEEELVDN